MLPFILLAYVFSLEASMAGMEFFGWLGFLLSLVFLILSYEKKFFDYARPFTFAEWCLLGFFVAVVCGALMNTPEPTDRLFTIGRTRGVILLFGLKFLILLTFSRRTEKVFYVLFGVATLAALNAFYQYFSGVDLLRSSNELIERMADNPPIVYRTIGFFNSSMTFANSIGALIAIPFAFALINPQNKLSSRIIFSLVTFILAAALVTTFTRGAWIGALAALLVIACLKGWRAFVLMVAAITLTAYVTPKIHPYMEYRVRTTFDTHTKSASERIKLWKANFTIFKDYPLLGIGYGENERVIRQYYEKFNVASGFDGHAHSNFFQFLAGTGALGTFFFYGFAILLLIMNFKLWFKVRHNRDWITAFVLGALGTQIAMHVGGITECNFKDMEINHLFIFVFSMLLAVNYKVTKENIVKTQN